MPILLHRPARLGAALLCLLLLITLAALPRASHSAAGTATFDPASVQLRLMGRIEGTIRALDLENGLLAVSGMSSLTFYDVSDAAQPRALSTLTLPDMGSAVVIDGDIVYASWLACSRAARAPGLTDGISAGQKKML